MTGFKVPSATYRLQIHHGFRFIAAQAMVSYLHKLGISDLYASPILKARYRSTHGYSVTNPLEINPELGSRVSLKSLVRVLNSHGMGLLLDIVPNHMALSHDNPWWLEVLEDGPASPYAMFFDIDWDPPHRILDGKVLQPILGVPYGEALEKQEIRLILEAQGFCFEYYDHKFPLDPKTYWFLLTHRLDNLIQELGEEDPGVVTLKGLITFIENLPPRSMSSKKKLLDRQRQKEILKKNLWLHFQANPTIKNFLEGNLLIFNGKKGEPQSFNLLDQLLRLQPYRLAYWRVALDLINYRRFFSVNDLIGLRIEDPQVFEASHSLLFNLIRDGKISGLRIDHIDGLFDPWEYLRRLQDRLMKTARGSGVLERDFFVVVEKILAEHETLPEAWPVAGTTGYDFLDRLNGLFIDPDGLQQIKRLYAGFTNSEASLFDVVYEKKMLVLETLFGGEVEALGHQLYLLAEQDRQARDLPRNDLLVALKEIIAGLPQYRTYIRSFEVSDRDLACLTQGLAASRHHNPALNPLAHDFVKRLLLLDFPPTLSDDQKKEWLRFVMRWQQFTGPIMAKGLEDTALYVYHPLVSLNEVGSSLRATPPESFHHFNMERLSFWPHSLNATATHDTKRGEDVRTRLNVLSEIPQEWDACLKRWSARNQSQKQTVNGMTAPDPNEEYFLYQTLIGAWPLYAEEIAEFKERLKAYIIKAAREAKVHTRWIATNLEYENALVAFAEAILDETDNYEFLDDFKKFQLKTAYYGALNSLCQVLLKITAPGVPDFYQGTELWDLSLVDPDNRRPVDFQKRVQLLTELHLKEAKEPELLVNGLLHNWRNGAIKLYITYKALDFRKAQLDLFLQGDYIPLMANGPKSRHVVAFARRWETSWVLVGAVRFLTRLLSPEDSCFHEGIWPGNFLPLPHEAPEEFFCVFSGRRVKALPQDQSGSLPLADLFQGLPVALLYGSASRR